MLSQVAGAWPTSACVIPLYQVKDNGQVFLRISRSNPASVLRVAAEEAEHIRHRESLWFFQHGLGERPMRVKRVAAREPFTLREKNGTNWPQSVDNHAARVPGVWVEFRGGRSNALFLEFGLLSLRRPAHHGAGLHREQLGEAHLPALFPGSQRQWPEWSRRRPPHLERRGLGRCHDPGDRW